MDDEAESSQAGRRHADDADDADDDKARAKQRRQDAKRTRLMLLDQLLRELDSLAFVELVALYYLDCSFFWFAVRALLQLLLLTPLPELRLAPLHDEHKAFLPLMLFTLVVSSLLHAVCRAPSAGEDTRGYLHGGLMIDFIGQQGPTAKCRLAALDMAIFALQLVMVSVHVKKRDLKKKLAGISSGASGASPRDGGASPAEPDATEPHAAQPDTAGREQDQDSEERGLLRRTDTLSDIGAPDEDDALLPADSEFAHADAMDALCSGQSVIGDFTLIDTLLQEHADYQVYRQTRPDTSLSPDALRQLHTIRARFGVGGG